MVAPSSTSAAAAPPPGVQHRRSAGWVPWLLAAAIFASVIFVALHFSEGREFARILDEARPRWLGLAILLQVATYAAQGEIFRAGIAGVSLSRRWLFQLSFAKLFLDQALPSGGIGTTVLMATALERKGIARSAAVSSVVVSMVSYYTGYVVALAAAIFFAGFFGSSAALIVPLALLFLALGIGLTAAILLLSGRRSPAVRNALRFPVLKQILDFLEGADPAIIRNPKRLVEATLWQIAIFLLDAATMWVLVRSLGVSVRPVAVFTSFMVSSLFRTMGIAPGGLGTYEAASIFTLRMIGLRFSLALSATLLFRGLSFWLPMLPGLWLSRRVTRKNVHLRGQAAEA